MGRKERIRIALLSRGRSQRSVATALGLSEATVSKVIAGVYPQRSVRSRRTHRDVMRELADQTGIPVEELEALRQDATAAA